MTRRLVIALLLTVAYVALEHALDYAVAIEAQRGGRGGRGGGGGGEGGGRGGRRGGGEGGGRGGGAGRGVKTDDIPAWHQQRKSTWDKALEKNQPIVYVFVAEKDKLNTRYWVDKAVSTISREGAIFVWIVEGESQVETNQTKEAEEVKGFGEGEEEEEDKKKEKPEPKKWIEGSRYEQKNLWEAYKVTKPDTIIFADYWGNELDRVSRKPSASTVEKWVKDLPKLQEKANESLTKAVKSGKENWEKGKKDKAIKDLTDLLNRGWVGFSNIEEARTALESYVKTAEEEFTNYWVKGELVAGIDLTKAQTAVQELARVFANTRLSPDFAAALAAIDQRLNPKKDEKSS